MIATNAAGATTFKYGSTRDWVQGLTVALASGRVLDLERGQAYAHSDGYFEIVDDGHITRIPVPSYQMPDVSKRSAGYFAAPGMDLVDLFIGSEGTLGIVTEASLRVVPQRPLTCLLWLTIPDEPTALALVASLRREAQATWRSHDTRGVDVAAIEHLDRRSVEILREDGADQAHGVRLPLDTAVALIAQVELPAGSFTTGDESYAQIADAQAADAPDTPLVRLCRLMAQASLLDRAEIVLPQDHRRQSQILALREAVPEAVNRRVAEARRLSPKVQKTAADMIVSFDRFEESLELFRGAFDRYSLDYAIWVHISDGNVHPNVIPHRPEDVQRGQDAIMTCGREIIAMGGCPLAEHGVGRNPVKQQLLLELYGEGGIEQMRRVKRALDPKWRLAPGVLFSGRG